MHIEPQGHGWWMGVRYADVWFAVACNGQVAADCRGCAAEFGMKVLGRGAQLHHRRTWRIGFLPGICLVFDTGGRGTVPAAEVLGHSAGCPVTEMGLAEEEGASSE